MSTTTNFKRIALVAVAALGMGVLSSTPSQALFSGTNGSQFTLSTTAATGGLAGTTSDSTTAGTLSISGLALVGTESFTVTTVTKTIPAGNTSAPQLRFLVVDSVGTTGGAPTLSGSTGSTAAGVVQADVALSTQTAYTQLVGDSRASITALSGGIGYLALKYKFFQDTSSAQRLAGTYVYSAIVTAYGGNPTSVVATSQIIDLTVTIAAAATASTTVSPSLSTAFIGTSSTSNTEDAALTGLATASATPVAYISTRTYNAAGSAAAESVTATITGAGTLFFGTASGATITIAGDGSDEIQVRPDGRSGVAVITVSTTTRTFAAKNVTFYAKAAKTITASVFNPTLTLGSNSTAIAATAVDSAGTNWAGAMYIVASAAADALVGGSATTPVACTYDADTKTHFCPVTTIATGTAKFKLIDAATVALATATSNEVTVTVANNPVATIKLAFNKATYQAGEKAYITVTALDSAGKTLQGQTFANLLATGGITTSYAFGNGSDTLTAVSIATSVSNSATTPSTAGAKTYTVYMPTTGSVKITATGGASVALAGQVEVSATATVSDSATAALAAVAALATTVASLKTLITTLTNLVLKIQKKVKA